MSYQPKTTTTNMMYTISVQKFKHSLFHYGAYRYRYSKSCQRIPPRVHSPPKAKKKPVPNKVGKNLKWHASESGDEEVKPESDNSVPKATKKRYEKQQQIEESKEEEEIIDENVEPPIQDVEDVDAERSGDDKVSRLQVESSLKWRTHAMLE
jgi:hypothetical protein